MAVGDDALSEDIPIISGATTLAKDIDLEINRGRDFLAQEIKSRRTELNRKYDKPADGAALVRNEPGSAHIVGFYTVANADLFYRPDPANAAFDRQVATWKEFLPVAQGKFTTDVYNRQITGPGRSAVIQNDGQLGYAASSERYKKNVRPEDVTDEQVLMLSLVSYQWRAAVAVDDRREMGLIAERLVDAGLGWACFYGDNGVEGINYNMIGVALLPAVQRLITRAHRIEDRLEALEAHHTTSGNPS